MALILYLLIHAISPARADEPAVRAAATRSVKLLQSVMSQWKQDCISCHHQALPFMAFAAAREHGIPVDETAAQTAANTTFGPALSSIDRAVQQPYLIDPGIMEGYIMVGAHAAGVEPSFTTSIIARRLARWQSDDGHWRIFDGRPPHSDSPFTSTALAARAVSLYAPNSVSYVTRARNWLLAAKPISTEDHAFRLLGLFWTGASPQQRKTAAEHAIALQRPDGGWGQLPGLGSDAYSTAEMVYALRISAAADVTDGVEYLLRTQKNDGSWQVETRLHSPAALSPPYFESGFPYGHSQFISCAATAWAVMALAKTLPVSPKSPLPVTTAKPIGIEPWMQTLDDPKAATPDGTTTLMFAAHDPVKVKQLLSRGANVNAKSKSGFDALMVASHYPDNVKTLRLLLNAGADPKPRNGVMFNMNALFLASFSGDAEMVEALIKKGADPMQQTLLLGLTPTRPLDAASLLENEAVMRTLVKHGAQVDAVDPDQMTALSWCALLHKDLAVKVLLELGAKPALTDKFGYTPLKHTQDIQYSPPSTAQILCAKAKTDPALCKN